jgi:hypothetical protein
MLLFAVYYAASDLHASGAVNSGDNFRQFPAQ